MRTFSVSFFIGTLVLLVLPRLPVLDALFWGGLASALTVIIGLGLYRRWMIASVLAGVLLGSGYAIWVASDVRGSWLPEAWEGEDILLTGTIADVPERQADGLRFVLDADTPTYTGKVAYGVVCR
ncbi:MAG: hypothetical protein BWK73_47115 [Thiothrix lacustris]|uniref:DUF4131 domain-containing protein n=1 Tax=Thiothrix lacustris TaxID=525917 RepID=A0A1Y1Q9Y8_9GAMM|nr:MAG: hypothetical protein BWK73_47115 [Thiothrix lacustris]